MTRTYPVSENRNYPAPDYVLNLDGLVCYLDEATASGGSGSVTQVGDTIVVVIDGTGASTPAAPGAWACWPVRDVIGDTISADDLGNFFARCTFTSFPPANSSMQVGVMLADTANPATATWWCCASLLFDGAQADPDVEHDPFDAAEAVSAATNAVAVDLNPWIQVDGTGGFQVRRSAAVAVLSTGLRSGVPVEDLLNDRVTGAYLHLVAFNRTGGGGATDSATVAVTQQATERA